MLQENAAEAEWVPAQVKAMHLDGRFLVAIGGADPFDDWLGWQDEGKVTLTRTLTLTLTLILTPTPTLTRILPPAPTLPLIQP